MSGRTEKILVLDSCICMNFLNGKLNALPEGRRFLSVITRMEILANPKHTEETVRRAKDFLQDVTVIPLTCGIEQIAISIRRAGSPRPKLPDAIVAATAVALGATLVSADEKLLKLVWPRLTTRGI
jgi:predicted nucleic acid-binding protein